MKRKPFLRLIRAAAFGAMLGIGASPAAAEAQKSAPGDVSDPAMTFTPGRLAGAGACDADCAQFIVADGEIGFGSALKFLFARKLAGDRNLPVLLSSPGGYMIGATNLGRIWRRLGVTVVIALGRRISCESSKPCDEKGVAFFDVAAERAECASACPFAFAGAVTRIAPQTAEIGVHEPHIDENTALGKTLARQSEAERKQSRAETEKELDAFLAEMGVDAELGRRAMRTRFDKMDWLKPDDVRRYRLSTAGVEALDAPAGLGAALSRPAASPSTVSKRPKSASGAFTKRQRP